MSNSEDDTEGQRCLARVLGHSEGSPDVSIVIEGCSGQGDRGEAGEKKRAEEE